MPIRFQFDAAQQILFTTAEGVISLAEIETHIQLEMGAKALSYRELIDATAATTNLTSAEVTVLVRRLQTIQKSTPFGPTALLTVNDTVFGMARMVEILSECNGGPTFGVFRTHHEALEWLSETGQPQ